MQQCITIARSLPACRGLRSLSKRCARSLRAASGCRLCCSGVWWPTVGLMDANEGPAAGKAAQHYVGSHAVRVSSQSSPQSPLSPEPAVRHTQDPLPAQQVGPSHDPSPAVEPLLRDAMVSGVRRLSLAASAGARTIAAPVESEASRALASGRTPELPLLTSSSPAAAAPAMQLAQHQRAGAGSASAVPAQRRQPIVAVRDGSPELPLLTTSSPASGAVAVQSQAREQQAAGSVPRQANRPRRTGVRGTWRFGRRAAQEAAVPAAWGGPAEPAVALADVGSGGQHEDRELEELELPEDDTAEADVEWDVNATVLNIFVTARKHAVDTAALVRHSHTRGPACEACCFAECTAHETQCVRTEWMHARELIASLPLQMRDISVAYGKLPPALAALPESGCDVTVQDFLAISQDSHEHLEMWMTGDQTLAREANAQFGEQQGVTDAALEHDSARTDAPAVAGQHSTAGGVGLSASYETPPRQWSRQGGQWRREGELEPPVHPATAPAGVVPASGVPLARCVLQTDQPELVK
jgi:hypothetical protein